MKEQIKQFYNAEFGSLEVLMIDGKPYFPATECAKILGYKNPRKALLDHCKKDGVTNRDSIDRLGRIQGKNYISEGNLYRLIIRSKLPEAERFEVWVFDEVLPSIRKHGAYVTFDVLDELLRNPKFADGLVKKLAAEREKLAAEQKKNAYLEELVDGLTPMALYCDRILQSKNTVPVSLIAKDYGMTATQFNRLLNVIGIQYRVGGAWVLYQAHATKGYTKSTTYYIGDKVSKMHTYWTQKGRLFLY